MVFIFKQIAAFKFDLMPFEEFNVFILKCSLTVVLFLIADVVLNRSGTGVTDGEGSVSFLPFEMLFY